MTDFPRHLRLLTTATATLAIAVFACAVARDGGLPPVVPCVLLAAMAIVAEHQRLTLRTGIDISPGVVVLAASVVVFRRFDATAGPILIGACGGLHLACTGSGRRGWIVFHAASSSLGAAAATACYWAMPAQFVARLPLGVLAIVPVACTAMIVETMVVAASYRIEGVTRLRHWAAELAVIGAEVLVFAVVGALIGVLINALGWSVVALLLVPVLLVRRVLASAVALGDAHASTLSALMHALEAKDPYTAAHAARVARYATYIGEELGMTTYRLEQLRQAALLHDVGKLVVPNQLLNKPGRLTPDEYAVVRRHEGVSVAMLSCIDLLGPISHAVADVRHDTDRQPRSLEAHVIAVADAYDAMTSTRSYRRALTQEVAFDELIAKSGTQFLTPCVDALITALTRRDERHGDGCEQAMEPTSAWRVAPPIAGVGSAGLGDFEPERTVDLDLDEAEVTDLFDRLGAAR